MTIIPQCIFILITMIAIYDQIKINKLNISCGIAWIFLYFILTWGGFFQSIFDLF